MACAGACARRAAHQRRLHRGAARSRLRLASYRIRGSAAREPFAAPPGHRISLSGKQAEACDLLLEYVALTPGRRYRLHWDARTVDLASPSGIEWAVGNTIRAVESAEAWRDGSAVFTAPAGLVPVKLRYRRPAGQPRAEGAVEIRNVSLTEEAR